MSQNLVSLKCPVGLPRQSNGIPPTRFSIIASPVFDMPGCWMANGPLPGIICGGTGGGGGGGGGRIACGGGGGGWWNGGKGWFGRKPGARPWNCGMGGGPAGNSGCGGGGGGGKFWNCDWYCCGNGGNGTWGGITWTLG